MGAGYVLSGIFCYGYSCRFVYQQVWLSAWSDIRTITLWNAASRLNLAQSFNGLGCICGPLIGGLLLFSEEGEAAISLPYTLMGIVVLAVAMVFSKIRLPEIVHEEEGDREGKAKSLWSHKLFIFGIAALFYKLRG